MFLNFRSLVPVAALMTLTTACHDEHVMNEAPPDPCADCTDGADAGEIAIAPECEDYDEVRSHTWDAAGRLGAVDIERRGEPVVRFEYGYDEAGRRVSATRLAPGEPPLVVGRVERELDYAGRLLVERRSAQGLMTEVIDTRDADGRLVAIDTTIVEATGPSIGLDTTPADAEDPTPLDGIADSQFDPAPGEVAMMWYPAGLRATTPEAEAMPEWWAIFAQPAHVDVTWHAVEDAPPSTHDGLFAFIIVSRDDTSRTRSWDFDGDGDVDAHEVTHLEEDGSVVSTEAWDDTLVPPQRTGETHFEGTTEVTTEGPQTTRVEHAADGQRIHKTDDRETDGHIDWEKTYEYDPEGRRTAERRDGDGDGVIDEVWVYAYDADGRLVTESKIYGSGDGLCDPVE